MAPLRSVRDLSQPVDRCWGKVGTAVVEDTIIKYMDLPPGRDYFWHADSNVLVLSSRLDAAGKLTALYDLFTEWRTTMLRVAA